MVKTGMEQLGIVILGATSTVGRAIAQHFSAEGHPIVLAARDLEEAELIAADLRVRFETKTAVLPFDALALDSHVRFVDICRQRLGGELGGVVLCLGHMEDQQKAQIDSAMARRILETNFNGAISILDHFANYFEARGRGFIAALSSVAGDRGRASNYYYGAAKAGLSTYLQGLRNRLFHAGVSVTTIKPGFMDTKMTYGLEGLFLVDSPEHAGGVIARAIISQRNIVYVPWFWRFIMLVIRSIPEWHFKRMRL